MPRNTGSGGSSATIEPVMATLWAALFLLGESLTWPEIVGGALVVPGMIVLQQKDQRTNAPLHPLQFLGGNEEGNQE